MNIKKQTKIAAIACIVTSSGMALAQPGISTCSSPCTPSNVTNEVTLQVIVPETLTVKLGHLGANGLNSISSVNSNSELNTSWAYHSEANPAANTSGTVITYTASKP